jgi:hypothetical protein
LAASVSLVDNHPFGNNAVTGFRNAQRGLTISGTDYVYLDEGAYAVIFVDRKRGRVRKVYRNRPDAGREHCCQVFSAETEAYSVAANEPDLKNLVPGHFSKCSGQEIRDGSGNDVTKEFYPDLAFEAEFIDCTFQKVAMASEEEWKRVTALFHKHGIKHTNDMSVCITDGRITKALDFAIREIQLSWEG